MPISDWLPALSWVLQLKTYIITSSWLASQTNFQTQRVHSGVAVDPSDMAVSHFSFSFPCSSSERLGVTSHYLLWTPAPPPSPQRTGASRGGHRLVRPVTTRLNQGSTRQSACLPGHSPARPKQLPLHAGRTHKVSITAPLQHSWRSLTRATSAAGQGGAARHEWITSPRESAP